MDNLFVRSATSGTLGIIVSELSPRLKTSLLQIPVYPIKKEHCHSLVNIRGILITSCGAFQETFNTLLAYITIKALGLIFASSTSRGAAMLSLVFSIDLSLSSFHIVCPHPRFGPRRVQL